jgi:hypothetical protein
MKEKLAKLVDVKSIVTIVLTGIFSTCYQLRKRWDGLVEKVIYLIVAAMVGYALAKVGITT